MNFTPRHREEIDVNITPLIDVVFLLLIFFMVSTTFDQSSEVSITLPEASREVTQPKSGAIEVQIDAQSRIFINGKELVDTQIPTIKTALYEAVTDIEETPVIISADEQTPHQMVIKTMDSARQLGLVQIIFATRIDADDY